MEEKEGRQEGRKEGRVRMSRFDKDGWIDDEFVIFIKVYTYETDPRRSP